MLLKLDMRIIHEILTTEELPEPKSSPITTGLAIGRTTAAMLNACLRLVALLDTPAGTPYLARLIQREIVYRLRAIATTGDVSNRTAKAISRLRSNFRKPLSAAQSKDLRTHLDPEAWI
jgi:hypothetical protein